MGVEIEVGEDSSGHDHKSTGSAHRFPTSALFRAGHAGSGFGASGEQDLEPRGVEASAEGRRNVGEVGSELGLVHGGSSAWCASGVVGWKGRVAPCVEDGKLALNPDAGKSDKANGMRGQGS